MPSARKFALPIERYNDPDATQRLKQLVGPFILRRVKTDPTVIQDLPEKVETKVYCNLTEEQATLYQAVVRGCDARRLRRARASSAARQGAEHADAAQAGLQPPGPVPAPGRQGERHGS